MVSPTFGDDPFINNQNFATMIEKIIEKTNRIMCKAMAVLTTAFGFGNAIRCAFFLDYDRMADKVFYTFMLALIGLIGLWMFTIKDDE